MLKNKKIYSIFLAFILIASAIFPTFANGISIEPNKESYISGEKIKLSADVKSNEYVDWHYIDNKGNKNTISDNDKRTIEFIVPDNNTKETVSTIVYAVYEKKESKWTELNIEPKKEAKPLELVEMYPKNGTTNVDNNTEISLTFNQPVKLINAFAPKFGVRCDYKAYPSEESIRKNKLIIDEETPEKVILQMYDKDGKKVGLKSNGEYKIMVFPSRIASLEGSEKFKGVRMGQWAFRSKEPNEIKISEISSRVLYVGQTIKLRAIALDDDGNMIDDYKPLWGTNNPHKAIIDQEGQLIARSPGKVTIYVQDKRLTDKKATIDIEIKKENEYREKIKDSIDTASQIALNTNYSIDWVVVGLARSGKSHMIPKDYFQRTMNHLREKEKVSEGIASPTEYERKVLGILAAGGNPRNIDGRDLVEKIYNGDLEAQGLNSIFFGLIALDAGEFHVPENNAKWDREKIIKKILENESSYTKNGKKIKGGWVLKTEENPDKESGVDMTGMAMSALAPYYNEREDVRLAIDRAVKFLSVVQNDSGGYLSWNAANSEACAQVIMGLCTNGIDPTSDKFTKNGNNIVDALLSFEVPEHGGFAHSVGQDGNLELDGMATEQALYALAQYIYYLDGKGSIYSWGKDNIAPTIEVKNFPDEVVSKDSKLEFEVHVKDNRDNNIIPKVKFQNQVITKNDIGKYNIQLKEGKNTITIAAEDTSNNKVEKKYTIIRYKQKYPVGEKIKLDKSIPVKLEGPNGQINIDFGDIILEKEASLKVTDETENEKYEPNENTGLKIVGQIVNFGFEGIHIDGQHPATLKLSIEEGIDPNKTSIYHFNDEIKKWEYIESTYEDGKFITQVTDCSVYGIICDKKAPENPCVQSKLVSSDKVLLSMVANDDSAIKAYQVFRDDFEGEPKAVVNENEYLDIKVKANTKYKYRIKAVDVFGNISDFSKDLDISTPVSSSSGGDQSQEESKTVYIRIEGYDHTILPRTKIQVPVFDLTEYVRKGTGDSATDGGNWGVDQFKSPTVAHAIIKALESNGIRYDFQDYGWGLYVAMIDGEREKDHKGLSGWMYRLNNKLPQIGCQGKGINDEDELVWYYGAYGFANVYTKLTCDKKSIPTGGEVKIHADGYTGGFSNNGSSLEGARVLVNGEPFEMEGKAVKTDNKGNATLKFDEDGTYEISLVRYAENGKHYIDIVRPVPISIRVGTGKSSNKKEKVENTEYEEENKIVNDKNAKESEVVKAVDKATEKLRKKADEVKSEEDAKKLISHGKDVSKIMEKAIERVKKEESAKNIAKESRKVVEILGKSAIKLTKDEDKKQICKVIVENTHIILKAMDRIENQEELNKLAESMIEITKNLPNNIGKNNKEEVIENIIKVVEKVVKKATVKEFDKNELTIGKDKVVAKVDKDIIKEMAKNSASTIKVMNEKLKNNPLESKQEIEKKVTIQIPKTEKKEVEAKLPKDMMKILEENGIEKVAIKTETVIFNLTANTFNEKENSKEISLSCKTVDRNNLTPLQKHRVQKGCVVLDLNTKAGEKKVSNFNQPMEVSVPYKGEVKEGEEVEVFFLNDNGIIESMGGAYDATTKMVTFTTGHFSKYFAKKVDKEEIKVTFKDLEGYEWAKEAIEAMANKGIINGRGEGIFDPSANITRAEFATLVSKMMGYSTENMNVPFTDVAKDAWHYNYVGAAYKNGLISGRSETVFDPNGNITRQEMAVIVAKVLEQKGYEKAGLEELNIFKDRETIVSWARDSVSLCAKENIISGMGDGIFAPKQNANRAQAAAILFKVYELNK